jgi:hypothetical protein
MLARTADVIRLIRGVLHASILCFCSLLLISDLCTMSLYFWNFTYQLRLLRVLFHILY